MISDQAEFCGAGWKGSGGQGRGKKETERGEGRAGGARSVGTADKPEANERGTWTSEELGGRKKKSTGGVNSRPTEHRGSGRRGEYILRFREG